GPSASRLRSKLAALEPAPATLGRGVGSLHRRVRRDTGGTLGHALDRRSAIALGSLAAFAIVACSGERAPAATAVARPFLAVASTSATLGPSSGFTPSEVR